MTKNKVRLGVEVCLHGPFFVDTDDFALDAKEFDEQEAAKIVRKCYEDMAFCFRPCFYIEGEKYYKPKSRGWIYFGGSVRTREEVLEESRPSEETLRANLTYNKDIPAVIRVGCHTYPFYESDKVLENPN